ncbi:MAG: CusA/CzcA family heavy metal efflux RND transporter [Verrucomicrobia bacterium]|nr:MAG: CusA/CzcA family heavy metal efflux RND transporter [Verrucomicrobiota bacterium]
MINSILAWSVRNRLMVICATIGLIGWGIKCLYETPVDAIPDLGEKQVIVFADWPGRSPRDVESQITRPLSLHLQGLAGVKAVRGSSMFGSSLVTVIFEDKVDSSAARQRVLERLNFISDSLPRDVQPKLGPDAPGLGWVYEYYLDASSAPSDLGQLRSLQDNYIRLQLSAVPGVAEVASVGGFVRQYQIEVDSQKMRALGVSLKMVMQAVADSNLSVGGKAIEENGMEFIVRGVGLIKSAEDLGNIVLARTNDVPVCLKAVARIELGGDFRRGALDAAGREVVGGIVVMRAGENPGDVISRVKARIAQLSPTLPPGVVIRPFYDRGELIDRSIATLRSALIEEIILVTLAHVIFLFHFRSVLVVTLPLPASILASFILMRLFGFTSNIMSLSGIAIALGVLVDAAIVMTDNVIRRQQQERGIYPASTSVVSAGLKSRTRLAFGRRSGLKAALHQKTVLAATQQVGRPIIFAMGIILLAFVPVFALNGPEGKLFHPLAFAKTFAMLAATLMALTIVPVLCTLLVRGPFHSEEQNPVMRLLLKLYDPVLDFALNHRRSVLAIASVILAGALSLAPRMGKEFMPPLNEGSLLFMPTFVPGASLSEIKRVTAWQDQVIAAFPEVQSAVGKLGRADTATDPAPVEMIETTITLKPENQWRAGMSRDKLIAEMSDALRAIPGAVPGFVQPIQGRILMISTGIRAQLGIKIIGDDFDRLEQAALQVQKVVQDVTGAEGVAASRNQGRHYIEVQVNRQTMTRFGMTAQDVLSVVEAGIGGKVVTRSAELRFGASGDSVLVAPKQRPEPGRPSALQSESVPVQVRLQRSERDDLTRLRDILVSSDSGNVIPLGQLADIERVEGPAEIATENGRLRAYVQANVDGRDLSGFVQDVKARLEKDLAPRLALQGMTLEYCGEYENQVHAARTLMFIVPSVLLVIFLLLRQLYGSALEAAHVILAVPFALSGGFFLQYALGWHFSVAVWVGYIALFGTAIQTAVVMVVYLNEAVQRKQLQRGAAFSRADLIAAVKEGARLRLRPKVMTATTVIASLLPVMWSHRTGSEIIQPLAAPIIGGMVTSLAHILIVTPVLFLWLREKKVATKAATVPVAVPAPSQYGSLELAPSQA